MLNEKRLQEHKNISAASYQAFMVSCGSSITPFTTRSKEQEITKRTFNLLEADILPYKTRWTKCRLRRSESEAHLNFLSVFCFLRWVDVMFSYFMLLDGCVI